MGEKRHQCDKCASQLPSPGCWAHWGLAGGMGTGMKMHLQRHFGGPSHVTETGERQGKPIPLTYAVLSTPEGCWQTDANRLDVRAGYSHPGSQHVECPLSHILALREETHWNFLVFFFLFSFPFFSGRQMQDNRDSYREICLAQVQVIHYF